MKTLHQLLTLMAFASGILLSVPAHAQKMNEETQDLVIQKMERVLSAMDKKNSAWLPSQQRLADLLSERARTRFMREIEAQCEGCKGSKQDRQKAIDIYESLLKNVRLNEHAPILFQLAHLYEMAQQQGKAISLYEKIIKEAKAQKTKPVIVSRSHANLGDLFFQKAQFTQAHKHYTAALKDKNLDNRSLTIYNKAWSEFNSDQLNRAIRTLENLLKNPQAVSRTTAEGSQYDAVFHADILRDLATFYSRRNISARDIKTYDSLLPADKNKELTLHFADEADRVGQKQAAYQILTKYLQTPDLSKEERLTAFVKLAQVNYDRGHSAQSTADFAKAAEVYQKGGCSDRSECPELEKMMKRYVTELHRSKKLKPDPSLLNAYVIYQRTFPRDAEMTQRAAQVAVEIGNHTVAIQMYRAISESRHFTDKQRQTALMDEVSLAEKAGNPTLQKDAYLHFLKYSSDKERNFAIRYQLAYLSYQQKQLPEAAKAFNDLATESKGNAQLRLKSAHLSLDSLAQLKDDQTLEKWANTYAQTFPQSKAEFQALAHKALMNRVAKIANDKKSSQRDLRRALDDINDSKNPGVTATERIVFYTNQSVLALKTGEDKIYLSSLQSLLNQPLSASQRNETLQQLASFYEKKLDFKNAYKTSLRISKTKESEKDRQYRWGTLADLAEMNPSSHYRKALKAGLRGDQSLMVRARLVALAKNPLKELKAQSSYLKKKPALLSEMAIYVFAKSGYSKSLQKIVDMKELRRQPAPLFVKKQDFYKKITAFDKKIAAHKLNTKTDTRMAKSIEARIALLAKADSHMAESLKLKDVTAEMLALNIVWRENDRLVRDLAALPMPKNLTPAQQQQYIDLLKAKSKPFLYKAKVAQQQQENIWDKSAGLQQLISDYNTARPEVQKMLAQELQMLSQLPSTGKLKSEVQSALRKGSFSSRDLLSARRSVSDNPESIRDLENLKFLETKIGHPLMSSYLEARLNHLQRGRSL